MIDDRGLAGGREKMFIFQTVRLSGSFREGPHNGGVFGIGNVNDFKQGYYSIRVLWGVNANGKAMARSRICKLRMGTMCFTFGDGRPGKAAAEVNGNNVVACFYCTNLITRQSLTEISIRRYGGVGRGG